MELLNLLTLKQLEKYSYVKEYEGNKVVFYEHELCDRIGIVIEGKVVIAASINNTKEEIISTLDKDDIFGQYLVFSKNNYYLGTCYTLTKSIIRYISRKNLEVLFDLNKPFLYKYLELNCDGSIALKNQVKLLAHKNITDRIIYYLNLNKNDNKIYIKSITDLSNILSLPRPSVSREISKLEKEGIIKREGKYIYMKNNP